jgi:hypothetical protein
MSDGGERSHPVAMQASFRPVIADEQGLPERNM